MTKLFLGLFDITVSLLVYLPFAGVCLAAADSFKKLLRRRSIRKNAAVFTLSAIYIIAFICFKVYKPDFLAPMFFAITCLVPVAKGYKKLMSEPQYAVSPHGRQQS